ncbi:hypothetical protein ACIA49_38755 [Kribbella sp. NPDC051587]|uniref:hypothetical protein n=1 Tax=Kribbella sp. NPDC051587 TaxID=3364119 RepID=UPI0037AC5721
MKPKTARKLLRSLLPDNVEPDERLVAKIATDLVKPLGAPGSVRWQAARTVISAGRGITDDQVDAETQRRRAKHAMAVEEARRAAEKSADAAVAYVAQYRAAHGVGPTWYELAREMGWSHQTKGTSIRHLQKLGHLTFTTANRSLDLAQSPNSEVATAAI